MGWLLQLVLTAVQGWVFEPDVALPVGDCDSAARIEEVFVAGCRNGVFGGPRGGLGLLIPCPADELQPNRVRVLSKTHFLASTACGLFRIGTDGAVERLSFPPEPGALDADGEERAIVASGDGLWLLGPGDERKPVGRALSEDPVTTLELSGSLLLVRGERTLLLNLGTGRREEITGWPFVALLGTHVLCVDRSGRYRIRDEEGRSTEGSLSLPPFAGVRRVLGLGRQALALGDRSWFLLEAGAITGGRLPPGPGRAIPVRSGDGECPWMLAGGRLFRPSQRQGSGGLSAEWIPAGTGMLVDAGIAQAGLEVPPDSVCGAFWLPVLSFSVAAEGARNLGVDAEGFWHGSRRDVAFGVGMTWNWERPLLCEADGERARVQEEYRKQRDLLRERIALLVAAREQLAQVGDTLGTGEIDAEIEVLTGRRVP